MTRPQSAMPGSYPERRRAVPMTRVVAGGLAIVAALLGIIGLTEVARHPAGAPPLPADLSIPDPRIELDCPRPQPREGQDRPGPVVGPADAPVDVSSAILLECPETFDGATVRYEGEVVGGLLDRDGGTWTLVNDDAYGAALGPLPTHQVFLGNNGGMSVLLPDDVAEEITAVGGPDTRGNRVRVTGTFHRVDEGSGEVAVLKADTAEVVRAGYPITDPVLPDRRLIAVALTLVAIVVVGVERWTNRR